MRVPHHEDEHCRKYGVDIEDQAKQSDGAPGTPGRKSSAEL